LKYIKKDSESELIYYNNQSQLIESNIIKLQEDLNKLTNEYSHDKKSKDHEHATLLNSLNIVQSK